MNRLDAMALFLRVAELGSFTAAATQLGVARSVVTRQIAALEEHLGVKLMVRSTRRLALTTAGSAYLDKCRVILDLVEEAEAGVMEERLTPSGRLRLSLPLSLGLHRLMPLLVEFSQTWPAIELLMDFSNRQQNLIEEGIDLAIRVTPQLDPGQIVRKLGSCRLLAVAAPHYLDSHGRPMHPRELSGHVCLGYAPQGSDRPWSFQVDGELLAFHPTYRLQANNSDALVEATVQGLGISVQPDFVVTDHLAAGTLVTVLDEFVPPHLGIYAVLPSNRYLPHRVRVLIDFLAARLCAGDTAKP